MSGGQSGMYGAQTGGNMYGATTNPVGPTEGIQTVPIGQNPAFSPKVLQGGALPGGNSTDVAFGGGAPVGGGAFGAQTGGNMFGKAGGPTEGFGAPGYSLTGETGGNPLAAGGIGATVGANPFAAGGYQPPGAYGPRWATWGGGLPGPIDRFKTNPVDTRGPGTPTPTPTNPGTPGLPISAPPATMPKAGPGGVDHLANFRQLMAEDPSGRLASEYRLRSGDTIGWWQNQVSTGAAPGLLGGNQQMLDWMRGTSPLTSNTAPLTYAEMAKLNALAGIKGPSWLK